MANASLANFLSHTVQRKLPLLESMMDCLYAKCIPVISSCVVSIPSYTNLPKPKLTLSKMAELEKLGPRYRIALQIARDERWERLECNYISEQHSLIRLIHELRHWFSRKMLSESFLLHQSHLLLNQSSPISSKYI